jgi:hypothetical protein
MRRDGFTTTPVRVVHGFTRGTLLVYQRVISFRPPFVAGTVPPHLKRPTDATSLKQVFCLQTRAPTNSRVIAGGKEVRRKPSKSAAGGIGERQPIALPMAPVALQDAVSAA